MFQFFYGRRSFFWFSLAIIFCFSFDIQAQVSSAYLPTAQPDRIILNITENSAKSMAVNWRTSEGISESFAEIALASADPRFVQKTTSISAKTENFKFENETANYHSVVFENLQPNTKYAYRVGQKKEWSEWFHFTTAGNKGEKLEFIYFGDVQTDIKSLWSRVVRDAYARAPKSVLMMYAGDLINRANRDVEWGDWFEAGGFIHSMIPGFPSPGNHDHFKGPNGETITSVFWRPQFTLPENGPVGLEETAYFADVQGVRFISLNSDLAEISDEFLEKQKVWMEKILSQNPNKWTCVTFHHPIYSPKATRDNKRMRETFKPLFDKYMVDLVLQGHDHTYARGMARIPMEKAKAQSPTMYVVSVSGPKMTDSHVEKQSWMDRTAVYTQLYHVISIENNVLNFKAFTATGELYDAFDLIKKKGRINKLVDKIPNTPENR